MGHLISAWRVTDNMSSISWPIVACAARNRPWRTLAFLPHLTSSLLTKIGIIYTHLLQEEKIFPMMPRSEWSAEWNLRYAQKCKNVKKVEWKTQSKISWHYTWLLHAKNCPASRWRFLRSFLTVNKTSRKLITAAKRREREKKERRKKKIQKSKTLKFACGSWFTNSSRVLPTSRVHGFIRL